MSATAGLPAGLRLPAAVQTLAWALRPAELLEGCLRRYGEVFTLRLSALGDVVMVARPEELRAVFAAPAGQLDAGAANAFLEPLVGPSSVLLLDGAPHLRQRRLMLPPFHGERMRRYREEMEEATAAEVATWPQDRPFALRPRMQAITLEVIMRAVFGVREAERRERLRSVLLRLIAASAERPLIVMAPALRRDFGPWRPWSEFEQRRAAVDAVLYEEIARRRSEEPGEDILSGLLAARDEHGAPMSDRELRDELMTLLVAGHETTATGMAWAFERLLRHPAALDRLQSELAAGEEVYLEAVVKETLRLRPVLAIVARRLGAPTEVAGRVLPAGAYLAPCIHLIHRLPRLWGDPDAFRPERFLDGAADAIPPHAFIPFGGGARRCLGAAFALFEMKVVIATVLRHARLRTVDTPGESVRRRPLTLAPARGALVQRA